MPPGFKVMPYREPTGNEAFTDRFEGPVSFFTDNPGPIANPNDEDDKGETMSSKKRQKMRKKQPNFYDVI